MVASRGYERASTLPPRKAQKLTYLARRDRRGGGRVLSAGVPQNASDRLSERGNGSVPVPGAGVVELLVVLAQEVLAVVVAVRSAHHRVDVVARRVVVVERDPPLVIELDQDHRAVHPVV